ncbi:arylesterase [Nitrincola tapanii]|uniref:Arylesterase n=1 Tax=Nitrincola tapanii TaxID=1708751 RepID=A0A5A9W5Y7_9GAMM|nr:arylesterase [Nitrincola tapanii]KAA0876187.1 arylesterase [Nitrincola tapanii]
MRILLSWLLGLTLAWPLQAQTLLVLGDSLSAGYGLAAEEGWVSLLEKRLDQEMAALERPAVDLVNASISGETTAGGLARLPDLLSQHQPRWLLLQLGANDALRGTPLPVIRQQLQSLIETAQAASVQVILIGIRIPPNYGAQYAEGFFALYAELADQYNLVRVPFLLERVALDWSMMLPDGLHPNAQAQPLILDTVWPFLQPLLDSEKL